ACVCVTETPPGKDANSLLVDHGNDAITELIQTAQPATLSLEGQLLWLARLDPLDYALKRREASKKLGIPVGTLDAEVGRRGASPWNADADAAPQVVGDPELLDEAVDLAATLDDILAEVRRYVVAPDTLLGTTALWCAHAHLCHHEQVRLQRSPRLAIQAR